ncbi:MAG: T9SS type A sorting domain-containing protein [Prolixibacteraceae bacterium]
MFLALATLNISATNYYISTNGNNSTSGNSLANAWQTIGKVSEFAVNPGFKAGDSILFEGGQAFATTNEIYIQCDKTKGTAENPVVFSSYGNDKAIIKAKGCNAFRIYAPDNDSVALGLVLTSLIVEGDSIPKAGPANTYGIELRTKASKRLDNLLIENVEIRGFAGDAINTIRRSAAPRIKNIIVRDVVTHHNPGAKNVAPHSGSGILLSGADGALVEHCISYKNGINNDNPGGACAIWFWDCVNSTIQYCEAYDNETTHGDGGAFDIDGGCENCTIQYCYSHNNHGAGYLFCQFDGANNFGPMRGNIVRYNISVNDGRKGGYGGFVFWGANATDVVGENLIYNNTVYLGGDVISGTPACINFVGDKVKNIKFWNNVFVVDGDYDMIKASAFSTSKVHLQNNLYYATEDSEVKIKWGSKTYNSLSEWREKANGQEMNNDRPAGIQVDPMFIDAGFTETIGDTRKLSSITAYRVQENSPVINAGKDLTNEPFSVQSMGEIDFFNNKIPVGGYYDIGAFDTTGVEPVGVKNIDEPKLKITPNPTSGAIQISADKALTSISLIDTKGVVVKQSFGNGTCVQQLSLDKLKRGLYYVIALVDNKPITEKLIKL